MKISLALILAAAAFAAPVIANATESSISSSAISPIRLRDVQISQAFGILNDDNQPGTVSVAFTNDALVPATTVVFTLQAGGSVIDRFTDRGTYGHGVTVRHSFVEGAIDLDEQLAVESVSFADGTTWNNALTAPSRRQSQAQVSSAAAPLTAEQIRETSPNAL